MRNKEFFLQFGIFLLITAAFIAFQPKVAVLAPHTQLSWMTWALFTFTILNMFVLGNWAKASSDKKLFDKLLFFFHAFKIVAAVSLFFFYHSNLTTKDAGDWHALPFILLYIVFTGFEVHMLSRMVKG